MKCKTFAWLFNQTCNMSSFEYADSCRWTTQSLTLQTKLSTPKKQHRLSVSISFVMLGQNLYVCEAMHSLRHAHTCHRAGVRPSRMLGCKSTGATLALVHRPVRLLIMVNHLGAKYVLGRRNFIVAICEAVVTMLSAFLCCTKASHRTA